MTPVRCVEMEASALSTCTVCGDRTIGRIWYLVEPERARRGEPPRVAHKRHSDAEIQAAVEEAQDA
ncbi:hypothetical protein ABT160_02780 [Streptomyces sp. NPDC001941]|uniref:hypothetical protein n=1 Tax=Streptomyces sp. NPDC001941 TaxID=3154659 RepID=UPI0033271F27